MRRAWLTGRAAAMRCAALPCSAPILERCLGRLDWNRAREKEAKDAADEAERERMSMLSIDWCVQCNAMQCLHPCTTHADADADGFVPAVAVQADSGVRTCWPLWCCDLFPCCAMLRCAGEGRRMQHECGALVWRVRCGDVM